MEITTRVDRLEAALNQLAAAQIRTERHFEELAAAQQRTETRLEELAAAQGRTEATLAELAEGQRTLAAAQQRTETRLEELTAAQQRTETHLETLAAAQQRTEAQLGTLLSWQEGENGRQKGERLERATVRGAVTLFAGGEGGTTEQPHVQRRLARQLGAFLQNGASNIPAEADPALADVLWWKDDTVAVVEVSVVVDEHDVRRAHFRAETLRQAGATAVAAVVGDTWADGEVRFLAADVYRLAYKVGQEVSDAYVAFRRLPANTAAE